MVKGIMAPQSSKRESLLRLGRIILLPALMFTCTNVMAQNVVPVTASSQTNADALSGAHAPPPPPPQCFIGNKTVSCANPCAGFTGVQKYRTVTFSSAFNSETLHGTTDCKNSQRHGTETMFYANGKKATIAHYANDKLEGEQRNYSRKGELTFISVYSNGVLLQQDSFLPKGTFVGHGRITVRNIYKYEGTNTIVDEYFLEKAKPISGDIKERQIFTKGYMTFRLENGRREGIYSEYDEHSKLIRTLLFHEGKIVKEDTHKK